jgi:hypothetical protein
MGPWVGPKQGGVKHWIALVPQTKVQGWLVGRLRRRSLTAEAIKPGGFVTVTTETRDGRLTARSVEILRPSPEAGAR